MTEPPKPLLEARELAAARSERVLFQGLELVLNPGDVVWLRGRNGRGKTTLLRLLAGLASPHHGELRVFGRPQAKAGSEWRTELAYIGHAPALKDDLSAAQALAFVAGLRGSAPAASAVQAALARLGVAGSARAAVRTLSQGQRRRVALARLALPGAPRLWLLDEPFDALDDIGVATLNALIAAHAASGGAVLLTSHQPLSLAAPAPRVLDLDQFAVAA